MNAGCMQPSDPTASRDAVVPSGTSLAGDRPAARRRLPARVVRYWRWRAFFGLLPLVVLLVGVAIAVPLGFPWVGWGLAVVFFIVVVGATIVLTKMRYRVFWYAISPTEIDIQ